MRPKYAFYAQSLKNLRGHNPFGLSILNIKLRRYGLAKPLDKSAYQKNNFLISQPKLMGKKIFTILHSKILLI